jgi:hypothetical protein
MGSQNFGWRILSCHNTSTLMFILVSSNPPFVKTKDAWALAADCQCFRARRVKDNTSHFPSWFIYGSLIILPLMDLPLSPLLRWSASDSQPITLPIYTLSNQTTSDLYLQNSYVEEHINKTFLPIMCSGRLRFKSFKISAMVLLLSALLIAFGVGNFLLDKYGNGLHSVPGPCLASYTNLWRLFVT